MTVCVNTQTCVVVCVCVWLCVHRHLYNIDGNGTPKW